jgi:hypothetical protein
MGFTIRIFVLQLILASRWIRMIFLRRVKNVLAVQRLPIPVNEGQHLRPCNVVATTKVFTHPVGEN